ncbi:hypothetical protein BD779DRAFT_1556681, partial [Infundibulicybe gibba]
MGKRLGRKVIAKLSNPAETRFSEIKVVADARDYAKRSKKRRWVLKHLPLFLHHEDRTPGCVQAALFDHFGDSYEMRVPRVIIMEQLFPITQLTGAASAAPVYRDIVRCYEWLYKKCKILHGDISINNLMYRKSHNGIHGVLNDFDLARSRLDVGPQSKQRTGTRQFMALDLLDTKKSYSHFYRHDLESVFYVMVFHFCGHDQGKEATYPSLQDWLEVSNKALWEKKKAFLGSDMPSTTKRFAPLAIWLEELSHMFHQGYTDRKSH